MNRIVVVISFVLLIPLAASAESIDLSTAMAELESSNEEWEIVEERIRQSRELRREALGRLLPQLSARGATTYNGQTVEFGDTVVRRRIDWSAGGSASLTLFDGTQYPLVAQARKNIEVTELDADWRRRSLRFEVESAYFQLVAAQRDVEIAEQTIELREAYVKRATALEASGVALPLDVARATVQKLEAQQRLLEALARVGNQADALAVLLGREPNGKLRATATANDASAPPTDLVPAPDTRPDLEADRVEIDGLESLETSRWWSLAPRLGVQGDLGFGPPSFTAPDGVSWSITLSATWLLYDGGARYARIRQVQSQIRESQLRLQQTERMADARLAEALRSWRTAHQAVEVATQQVDVARQAYEMTVARFDSGLATSIEVTESSDQLFRAELDLSSARLAVDVASARYRYLSE